MRMSLNGDARSLGFAELTTTTTRAWWRLLRVLCASVGMMLHSHEEKDR